MLELYQAFADYHDMMELTEELVATRRAAALGTTTVEVDGRDASTSRRRGERATMLDLIHEHAGVDVHPSMPVEELQRICDDLGVPVRDGWGSGKLVLEIYEKTAEPKLVGPDVRRATTRARCRRSPGRTATTRRWSSGSSRSSAA